MSDLLSWHVLRKSKCPTRIGFVRFLDLAASRGSTEIESFYPRLRSELFLSNVPTLIATVPLKF